MVNNDALSQFNTIRDALKQEKQKLEIRLAEIEQALGEEKLPSKRPHNSLSLKDAVIKALAKRPLTKQEVLEEVQKLGYHFSTNAPLNSIGSVLYGKNPKFQNSGGRFSLPKSNR